MAGDVAVIMIADESDELSLKAMVRGYNFTIIPITWDNRRLYVWLEKFFPRGDYQKI